MRNLNIIRQQLLPILNEFVTSEIVDEEKQHHEDQLRRTMQYRSRINFEENEYTRDPSVWWVAKIGDINRKLRQQIAENDWKTLFNLEICRTLVIEQQHAVIFGEFVSVFMEDVRQREMKEDLERYLKDYPDEYFRHFVAQNSRTPRWWHEEHDKLLLELALRFNYSSDDFVTELSGTKKRYYQYRLRKKAVAKRQQRRVRVNGGVFEMQQQQPHHREQPLSLAMTSSAFLRQMSGKYTSRLDLEHKDEEKYADTLEVDESEEIGYAASYGI